MIQLNFRHHQIAPSNDRGVKPIGWIPLGAACGVGCAPGLTMPNFEGAGPPVITVNPPYLPARPPRVSVFLLGGLVHKVLPEYPIIAKQLHIEGEVVLTATVGKDGRVERVRPISGPALLVGPAMLAVEQWQYRPYVLNHEPVVVQTQITVNFVLSR